MCMTEAVGRALRHLVDVVILRGICSVDDVEVAGESGESLVAFLNKAPGRGQDMVQGCKEGIQSEGVFEDTEHNF